MSEQNLIEGLILIGMISTIITGNVAIHWIGYIALDRRWSMYRLSAAIIPTAIISITILLALLALSYQVLE